MVGHDITDLPKGQRTIGVKWVYKTKLNENGEVAHLVAKGYNQEYGVDYSEVFDPIVRLDTIRLMVALEARNKWFIYKLDVKSAFLHGEFQEQVYVDQPLVTLSMVAKINFANWKKALYA